MIKNYLLIAFRSLKKHLTYSVINILGLSLGLTTFLLLAVWLRHELSYDKFHDKSGHIYRASLEYSFGGQTSKTSVSPTALLPALQKNFPDVEAGVRVYNPTAWRPFILRKDDKLFQESKFYFADSTFFQVFSYKLASGNANNALTEPNSILLTRSMAKKYFGKEDVIGQTLQVNNKADYTVTGILEDVPTNSMLQFDFLASFSSLPQSKDLQWWSANYQTYVVLSPRANVADLTAKTQALVQNELNDQLANPGDYVKYNFMKLTDVYLHSDMEEYNTAVSSIQYVYIFGAIALLVLVIACINYVNLATARAADRAKEVGIRKVVGALRKQLFIQFISESTIITLVSLTIAFMLAKLTLPLFNHITGKAFDSSLFINPLFVATALLGAIVLAWVAGAYPALAITSFKPVSVLKGNFKTSGKGIWLRKGLVIFQFAVSIILIVGTIVVLKQLSFIQDKKLGFEKENTVILPYDAKTHAVFSQFRTEILRSGIASHIALAAESPTKIGGGYTMGIGAEHDIIVTADPADDQFIPAMGMEIVAGRNFIAADTMRTDSIRSVVLNESAMKELGLSLEKSVGERARFNGYPAEIIGVVKDFHFAPMQQPIGPLVLFNERQNYSFIFIKLKAGDTQRSIATLQRICAELTPHRPFEYKFLDEQYNGLYENEVRMGQISTTFALLTILIACLGLFGLISFSAAQKTKEIGIRKVMGATEISIVLLLTRDFTRLVITSIIIGVPLAYWIMSQWLNDFAYKTTIGVWPVVTASAIALVIALGTASFQAIKSALVNPVTTLRSE
jgi:putative ABC transport system permease protein